jgi:STE24 endopeptidase
MQFVLILAILTALTICECAIRQPVSGQGGRLLMAGAGMAAVVLFALWISRRTARRLRTDATEQALLLRRFRLLRRVHAVLWLVTGGGILYCLDWARLVRFNWGLDGAFLIDEVLALVPVLLPLVLSWAAFYEVDRAVRAVPPGQASPAESSGRGRYLVFHVRHYLGMALLPVLGLLAVQDAVEWLAPGVLESGHDAAVFLPAVAVLFLLFPVLLRYVWQTRPLAAGPLRNRLEDAARRCGFHARDILVWYTDGMLLNAAVAGFVRPVRYVFLTDSLLGRLTDEEIEAVFGHEVGHVRHHHLLLRVLTVIAPLSLWLLLRQAAPAAVEQWQQWLQSGGLGRQAEFGLIMLGAMALYVLLVFGYYSRQLEHQADWFGCRSMARDPQQSAVDTFTSALEKLAAGSGLGRNTRSWQHASIARRVEFLNQLNRDAKRELDFQRRVRLLGSLVVGIVLSPVAYRLLLG